MIGFVLCLLAGNSCSMFLARLPSLSARLDVYLLVALGGGCSYPPRQDQFLASQLRCC